MTNYGIKKVYEIRKIVKKKLILNDKVVDYFFKVLNKDKNRKFVIRTGYDKYIDITKDEIKKLLAGDLDKETIVELDEYPEYDDMPFVISHASPYNHRWENDYDPDAYEDWKVDTWSLSDLFYNDHYGFGWGGFADKPYYVEHPDEFDWEDEVEEYTNEKFDHEDYIWR